MDIVEEYANDWDFGSQCGSQYMFQLIRRDQVSHFGFEVTE